MVFSPQNRRYSLAVIAIVVMGLGVLAAVVALEIIAARPGHVNDGCGSISRVLGFGGTMLAVLGAQLRNEYLAKRHEERTVGRSERLQRDVRHDVANKVQPVVLAVEDLTQKAAAAAEKVEKATNGNLAEAVRVAAEQARQAEREQMFSDPRFWGAMESNLRRLINGLLDEREQGKGE